jgi:NAD+ synthase
MGIKTTAERAQALRNYALRHRRKTLINSLSGGVDSTLSGTISKQAETEGLKAIALNLPCSQDPVRNQDQVDAARVAQQLGMPLVTVDLTGIWLVLQKLLVPALEEMASKSGVPLAAERVKWALNNLKPTLRMMVGGVFADAFDGLTIGTDNAVENFLGYFSIRGDGIADVQPIRDLLKAEVHQALVTAGFPADLAFRTATPGLFDFENHTDEGELGFRYVDADAFVAWVLQEEARHLDAGRKPTFVLLDETMTLKEGWDRQATATPCPVSPEVAAKIARQNQKTFFKRKRTDLVDTMRARGLCA